MLHPFSDPALPFSDTQRKEIDGAVILGLVHGRSRDGSDGNWRNEANK